MKNETRQHLSDLESFPWFSEVGKPRTREMTGIVCVTQWMEAVSHLLDGLWEVIGFEEGAALEKGVKAVSKTKIKEWKKVHAELQPLARKMAKEKLDKVRKHRELSRMVDMIVSYDIQYALLEVEFADVIEPGFFSWKMGWYSRGRFPCGVTDEEKPIIF